MIKISTKILFIVMASTLSMNTPAFACDTVDNQVGVFRTVMPDVETIDPDKEFIGEITIRRKTKWFFFKEDKSEGLYAFVNTSPSHPELGGRLLSVFPLFETSCGPGIDAGQRGFVKAIITPKNDGTYFLNLETFRGGFELLQNRPAE